MGMKIGEALEKGLSERGFNLDNEELFVILNLIGAEDGYLDESAKKFRNAAYDEGLYQTTKDFINSITTSVSIEFEGGRRCVVSVNMGCRAKDPILLEFYQDGEMKAAWQGGWMLIF